MYIEGGKRGGGSLVGAFVVGREGGGVSSIMCVYISHSVHLSVCLSVGLLVGLS